MYAESFSNSADYRDMHKRIEEKVTKEDTRSSSQHAKFVSTQQVEWWLAIRRKEVDTQVFVTARSEGVE